MVACDDLILALRSRDNYGGSSVTDSPGETLELPLLADWLQSANAEHFNLWPKHCLEMTGSEILRPKEYNMTASYFWRPPEQHEVNLYQVRNLLVTWQCDLFYENASFTAGHVTPGYTHRGSTSRLESNPRLIEAELTCPSTFVFLHNPVGTYGHFMLEMLPKIAVYRQLVAVVPTLPIIVTSTAPAYVTRWIELLVPQANVVRVPEGKTMSVKRAFCVDMFLSHYFAGGIFKDFLGICRGLPGVVCSSAKKIWVSRRTRREALSDFRTLANAAEIEEFVANEGFHIVEPEKLPIVQQIAIFTHAEVIGGELSSGLHNAVFSLPGTRLVQINPFNAVQRNLALSLGHLLESIVPEDGVLRGYPGKPEVPQNYTVELSQIKEAILEYR